MVCSLRAFPSREKDCRASHENGNRELPARAGGDSPMGAPSSEGDTRGDSDDDFCARHTAGTCGSADTLVGEPLHVLRGEHTPAVIPDLQMERFKFMLDYSEEAVEMCSTPLAPGEMVRVIKGPLAGMEGELVNVDGRSKVVVRLEMLGCAGVDMPVGFVEAVK